MDLAEREQNATRRELFPLLLGPCEVPQRVRGEFLHLPVLSAWFLVHDFARTKDTGEVHGGAHGGHRAGALGGGRPPPGSPLLLVDRPIEDEGIGLEDTPSAVFLFKSP